MRLRYLLVPLLVSLQLLLCATSSVEQLWQVADELWRAEQLDSVMEILLQIEKQEPGGLQTRVGQATIYRERKEFDQALEILNRVLEQEPRHPLVLQRIGEVYSDMHETPKALEYFHAAEHEMDPANTEEIDALMHRIALAYHRSDDDAMAETFFKRVSEHGHSAAFYFDLGVSLEKLGKIVEAGDAYREAIQIDPEQSYARLNLAALHHQFGDVNDSIPFYLGVISSPSAPQRIKLMAMGNVGAAYEATRDIVSALSWYERALLVSGNMSSSDEISSRMHLMTHVVRAKLSACVWANAEHDFDVLWSMVTTMQMTVGTPVIFPPFDSLLHPLQTQDRKALAAHFSNKFYAGYVDAESKHDKPVIKLQGGVSTDQRSRLNVAYLSYDFSDHPTAHLMEGIFATTDRSLTKVVAFGYGRDDGSDFRQRITRSVEKFVGIADASFEQSANRIRDEQIHIIMDAQGHTRGGRMQIVAACPAPIVVNYLVYPGTSGADFVDYIVVDKFVVPPAELASAFTEKLVVMPNSYQVNYYEQVLASVEVAPRRSNLWEFGEVKQKDHGFVFINFNKIDKLEASVFSTWMAILRRVPESSLLLLDPGRFVPENDGAESVTSREIKKNLWREADAQGVSRRRIQFVSRIPKIEHLRRHRLGGLFLDTFVYGAHSTATDALYAGLPVLTLAGDSFASRVGVSLLMNLGMQELITFSGKEYEDLAVYLATTPSVLKRLQHQLRRDEIEVKYPLFRTREYTRSLEESQRLMYDIYALTNRTFHLVV